jgi:hypothetical protein
VIKTSFFSIILVFLVFSSGFSYNENNSTNECLSDPFLNNTEFLVDLEGFEAKPPKRKIINFFGNILIEKRVYKNSKGKFKVRLYRGKNLINNWKSLLFVLAGFSENQLKPIEINNIEAKLYTKENYKAIILPVLETQDSGIVVIFSSEAFSLEEMIDLIKKFPLKNFNLTSCPYN